MVSRTDIINALIKRYSYQSYLEIGVEHGINFRAVLAPDKVSVDPNVATATFPMTSDHYFATSARNFDIVFIDGFHDCDQVDRDIVNSLRFLNDNGTIVVHDCNPPTEEMQVKLHERKGLSWTGDVWKSIAKLRITREDLSVCVVDVETGCGIVRRGTQKLFPKHMLHELNYTLFDANRRELLNLVDAETWLKDLGK